MSERRRSRRRSGGGPGGLQHGIGEPSGEPVVAMQNGGTVNYSLSPTAIDRSGGMVKSQYYTISGGSKRRGKRSSRRSSGKRSSKRKHRGGSAVLAAAAVPLGLFALQRYFKGSKTSKQGVKNMGRSFKRTFRRR